MTVLFLAPLPDPITGQSLACRVLLDELTVRYRVVVVDMTKRDFRQGASSLGRLWEVARILRQAWRMRNAGDVIYLTISESFAGNLKDLLIYAICYRRLSRMVIHLHGGAGIRHLLMAERGLRKALNSFFLRRLGAVIVLGQRHVDMFAGLVAAPTIHVVPNFAEDYLFRDPARIEAKFADVPPLRVLFLSNLLPGKGHEELLEAYASLDERRRALITLDFAGGFEAKEQEERFVARLAEWPRVRYHGTVRGEAKKALLDQAHVFCLPTYYPYEGQPISILEAYASGCAVITTDHSGIGDVFTDGRNGYQVDVRSSPDLRRALEQAVDDVGRLRGMALVNRQVADHEYRTSTHTARVLRVIEGVRGSACTERADA
jgi:glycosyltransferase involved in cell wall biosynthesis